MKYLFLVTCLVFASAEAFAQEEITEKELKAHIEFLTTDSLAGRYPGTKANNHVVDYIVSQFKNNGISTLTQAFEVLLRKESTLTTTWNVIGLLEGNDPQLKKEVIVLGAHYDHLGKKGDSIYYGANDNASGTAALLEIAQKIKANQQLLKRSIIFIAFGAEEQGLLGSQFFVDNPIVPLANIKLMINMDMVGHLNEQQQVFMGGAGTFPNGEKLMKSLGQPNELHPIVHAGSVGGSDHVSFYQKGISVVGIHTGGNAHYHLPTDTLEHINLSGEVKVCQYIYDALMTIAGSDREMRFIQQE